MRFDRVPHPSPTPDARRRALLTDPGFGRVTTDHMVTVRWDRRRGWHDATVGPYAPLSLEPAAAVLHYGASIFEGLKVYRHADGRLAAFRPDANAARFRRSARRMGMPSLPEEIFLGALDELLRADHAWVPAAGGEDALYLRPLLLATGSGLVPGTADEFLFLLIASPAGAYFPGGLAPVRAWISDRHARAWPGGTGAAKTGANYAASLAAQAEAAAHGCDQVVWLDAHHRRDVEEMGVMNLFFVFDGPDAVEVVTPALNGSFLAGVTRDSLLTLAGDLGARVDERPVSADEWRERARDGSLREVFASGTAAVVPPVASVSDLAHGETLVADGHPGPTTTALREALTAVQQGRRPDAHGWIHAVAGS